MIHVLGFGALSRASDGSLTLLSYHPRGSVTWHWSVHLARTNYPTNRAKDRTGQWHDYYRLPFGYNLVVSQQDYHKR